MNLEVKKSIDFLPPVPVRKETKSAPFALSRLIHGDTKLAKELIPRTYGNRFVEFDFENESFMEYDCS